ncbi:dTDP-4-dehydrorhamnose 3,5-epimerase [Sulfurimonas indica]|uniref:dTDP-4-dehydrorhamnose 3,5-epimerase n=1 Tax=Sulfurimonas indica TaxID=2508707 RepID=UPI0012657A3B|nr:dTDP-4-dehydrorhamnose 3,5-epimerase [Sulfurimonas indica]
MTIKNHEIFQDILIIQPEVYTDDRGYFFESFQYKKIEKYINYNQFVLEFESQSKKNVLRGLHYQSNPKAQTKLISVSYGKVLDIIVDLRKESKNFGSYITLELDAKNHTQVLIPKGYAHGFLSLSDIVIMHYKLDDYYSEEHYTGVNIFDKQLNINLPIEKNNIILSDKDNKLPNLKNAILF